MKAEDVQFATNPEPRCACLILADNSGSMSGAPIAALNAGLVELKEQLIADPLASLRVELAVMSFSAQTVLEVDFTAPAQFTPPVLSTKGGTRLGAAIITALETLQARTAAYRTAGLAYFRPWLLVLTDAKPTDDVSQAASRLKEAEAKRRLAFFGVGVEGADMRQLAELSLRPPLQLDGLRFETLFQWLSANLSSVAASQPGDQIALTPPDWSTA